MQPNERVFTVTPKEIKLTTHNQQKLGKQKTVMFQKIWPTFCSQIFVSWHKILPKVFKKRLINRHELCSMTDCWLMLKSADKTESNWTQKQTHQISCFMKKMLYFMILLTDITEKKLNDKNKIKYDFVLHVHRQNICQQCPRCINRFIELSFFSTRPTQKQVTFEMVFLPNLLV